MNGADDRRIRTGTLWKEVAPAFTATIGSGILALPWSMAQLGPKKVLICGIIQYSILWGTMIGFTITTVINMAAFKRSICFHANGQNARCEAPGLLYMLLYGALEVIISQCPNLEKATFLSVAAAVTSFLYSVIVTGLSTAKLISSNLDFKGSIMLAQWGMDLTFSTKVWNVFQALGNVAFAFSTYSTLLLAIQDTLKSPPPENLVMKKVSLYSIGATTLFYFSVSFTGYATNGNEVRGNILTGLHNVVWLIDIANLCVTVHLIGAYQVFAQPIFALHEKWLVSRRPTSFLSTICTIKLRSIRNFTIQFTLARLLLRTIFVMFTTLVAMMFPFFNAVLGLIGSICFWPLTLYFPLTMYTIQPNIKKGSFTWIMFQVLGWFV